jgi:hypothetical protein
MGYFSFYQGGPPKVSLFIKRVFLILFSKAIYEEANNTATIHFLIDFTYKFTHK